MRTALEGARRGAPLAELLSEGQKSAALVQEIVHWLDEAKAEDVKTIDLAGKTSIGDFMVIATGRSDRHVGAVAEQISKKLKEKGLGRVRVEGLEACDWVLIDTGDIIVHVFRDEVREFYNLEKMWSADRPVDPTTAH
jgi:ribosome-associated protein